MDEAKEKKWKKMFQKYCNQKKAGSIVTKNILIVPQWNLTHAKSSYVKLPQNGYGGRGGLDRIKLNWSL